MIEQIRGQLLPLLTEIIDSLVDEPNDVAASFFSDIREELLRVETEVELMGPFIQLAGTAPVVNAVGVPPGVLFKIDELLCLAQELAHTLAADSLPH